MKKENKLWGKLIIFGCFVAVLLISLIFSKFIEFGLMLKPNLSNIGTNAFEIHFVDVGNGDAILVKFSNGKTMIVDSGAKLSEKKLLTYIDNVFFEDDKNKMFDFAVLTHSDSDHAGNMLTVLNNYKVKTFIRPKIYVKNLETGASGEQNYFDNSSDYAQIVTKLFELEKENKTKVEFAEFNTFYFTGLNAGMHILAPVKSYYNETNKLSSVMVVFDGEHKVMLTGDATIENEREIINNYNVSKLDVDVLKLGHHGSNTSTSLEFLEATTPKYAVVSVSKLNKYHPSQEVLNNIVSYNKNNPTNKVLVKQTSNLGNIVFYANGEDEFEILNIENVDDYLFLSWWIVVLCLVVVVGVSMFLPTLIALILKSTKSAIKN